jgi:hypothetical protein
MCRTIVTTKLTTLATVGEMRVLLVTTTDCGINITIYPENYHQPIVHHVTGDNYYYVTHRYNSIFAQVADPSNLNNCLPNSGATQHMTPRLADLQDMVGGQKLGIKVADGHVIKCSSTGTIYIAMQDDNGIPFQATLQDVMYVSGLSRRLFSLTKFAKHGHHALVKNNATILYFGSAGNSGHPVTVMTGNIHHTIVSDITVQQATYNLIPSA